MALTFGGSHLRGDHASRPAANTLVEGALYFCTDHQKFYRGTGPTNTWPDYTDAPALTSGTLAQFAATTSAELRGVLSDETGTGAAVFATAPTLSNPVVGTQSPGDNSTKAASTAYVEAAVAAGGGGGGGGAVTRITETVVGVGGAASVDFTSIANTYRDLRVRVRGRGDKAATFASLRARFNGDTGTNYLGQISNQNNTTYAGGAVTGQTYFEAGYITAASAPASYPSMTDILIGDYRGTTFYKPVHSATQLSTSSAAGGQWLQDTRGLWLSTSAINQVTVFPDSGNFAEGTVVTLYGVS